MSSNNKQTSNSMPPLDPYINNQQPPPPPPPLNPSPSPSSSSSSSSSSFSVVSSLYFKET